MLFIVDNCRLYRPISQVTISDKFIIRRQTTFICSGSICPWLESLDIVFSDDTVTLIFTVRRSALHGLCDRNSVRPSVCLSVCHTRGLCPHGLTYDHDFFTVWYSPIILVSGDTTFIPKFEGGHPERGRWMRVWWERIGDFWPISRRISETVRDTTKVTINH